MTELVVDAIAVAHVDFEQRDRCCITRREVPREHRVEAISSSCRFRRTNTIPDSFNDSNATASRMMTVAGSKGARDHGGPLVPRRLDGAAGRTAP
jgi:hypothetical protein